MRAKIENRSPTPRKHWAVVTFPTSRAIGFDDHCRFVTDSGAIWRAVRGSTDGQGTAFRIECDMSGGKSVEGTLVNDPVDTSPFEFHPWVIDDIVDLIPTLDGIACEPVGAASLVDSSPAHQRWHLKLRAPAHGLVTEWWVDIFSGDPVAKVYGKIIWSDRDDPRSSRSFDEGFFRLSLGEFHSVDFATRLGVRPPVRVGDRWVSTLNSSPLTLNDGSGIAFSLSVACFRSEYGTASPNEDENEFTRDLANLQAALSGDIYGACTEWGSEWLAARRIPAYYYGLLSSARSETDGFWSSMQVERGWLEPISIGLGRTPFQTGSQEDFGLTKGTNVVRSHEPSYIAALRFASYTETLRGMNHYERDGRKLRASEHPQWVTWSGGTHWHTGASPDRLGKTEATGFGTGWHGYDDQHRSQNNFAAYALLSDDPIVRDQMSHQLETDKACHRIRFNGTGAARAQGRHLGAWAQMASVSSGSERRAWLELIDRRAASSLSQPSMNVAGPMRVLSVHNADFRRAVYIDGVLAPSVSVWEHGLAAVGLYKAYQQNPTTDLQVLLTRVCIFLHEFGWLSMDGEVYTVGELAWLDGDRVSLDPSNGWDGSGASPGTQQFSYSLGGGVGEWTKAGLRIAREWLGLEDSELDMLLSGLPRNRMSAEWML